MGMFDYVTCKCPVPDPEAQDLLFQTKDLECLMDNYEITEKGRLIHTWKYESNPVETDLNYHGMLNFYGNKYSGELRAISLHTGEDSLHPGPEPEWFEYTAKFTDGFCVSIERVNGSK